MTGTQCSIEDKFKDTKFRFFFNAVLILVWFSGFTSFVVLYSLIGRVTLQHSTFNVKNGPAAKYESNGSGTASDTKETSVPSKSPIKSPSVSIAITSGSENYAPLSETKSSSTTAKTDDKQTKEESKFSKMRKTTYTLFVITVVTFVSYFPHLILQTITASNTNFVRNMSFTGKVFYSTFNLCYFISNMANPITYSLCDVRFRREVFSIYRNLCKRR